MKPIHLNLASRPYRDDRALYAISAVLALAVAFLMIRNVQTAVEYFSATRTTRQEISRLESSIEAERAKSSNIDNRIKGINLRVLNAQVNYINSEIAIRSFSWTALLDQLERDLPNDVRITTLIPNFNKNGSTHLRMECVSKTGQGLITFLNRLLADPHFSRPFPNSEAELPGGEHGFVLEVDYRGNNVLTEVAP